MSTTATNGSKSVDNRARLLELSASLFATEGYAQVSVRDLAAKLGMTTGAIYSNFKSKGDLLAAVLDVRIEADMERAERSRSDFVWLPQVVHESFLRTSERSQMRALLLEAAATSRTDRVLRESVHPTLAALLSRWNDDYRSWQQASDVDPDVDMADLCTVLWAIELGTGVLEAEDAVQVHAGSLAEFIGGFLESLEGEGAERPDDAQLRSDVSLTGANGPPSNPRPSSERSQARRLLSHEPFQDGSTQKRLVDAAIELFAEKGYADVTVRDLARATGLTTGSIYGNFANKANLLVEAIEASIANDLESLPASLVESGSPIEMVEFHLQSFAGRARLRALLIEGAATARSDREVHDRLRELQVRHFDYWVAGCERWLNVCESPPTADMLTAISAVWTAELGFALFEALDLHTPSPSTMAALFRRFFEAFGLAETEAPAPRRANQA
jgi:AcrR family transcriptional regulator